jgi:1,2-diacylglycerol 3-beta-galactosyltransferase
MSDTGGGHKASAQAITAALRELYPEQLDIDIVDIWTDHSEWPFNRAVGTYQFAQKHPFVWKALYEWATFPVSQWMTRRLCAARCFKKLKRFLINQAPDMIISVHPLCQHLPLRISNHIHGGQEKRREKCPFVTVVTDLGGGHPLWFHPQVDATYVPSDAIVELGKRHKYPQEHLHKYGLPIRPGFSARSATDKEALRAELGIRDVRTALIVGGGDGVGKIAKIAKELALSLDADGGGPGQLVVVCGKNTAVQQKLKAQKWPTNITVTTLGFVRNMDQWMGAADCIVTKAGPGTIAEACASGLPILVSAFLPGQEQGNVPYVVEGGFGAYKTKPKQIAETVSGWLNDPERLADMSLKSSEAGRPGATKEIAMHIGKLLYDGVK